MDYYDKIFEFLDNTDRLILGLFAGLTIFVVAYLSYKYYVYKMKVDNPFFQIRNRIGTLEIAEETQTFVNE